MSFNLFNRRLHLYLAMFLLPWFFMYGISAIPFTRNTYFQKLYDDGIPQWTLRFERGCTRPVPEHASDHELRQIAAWILKDLDIDRPFGVHRPNKNRLNIYQVNFWDHTRLTYYIDQGRIEVEDKRFRWDQFFTTMHARGGFQHDEFLIDAWAVLVDIVCIGILLWIASGLYMWWQLGRTRRWGVLALGGGIASFVLFLLAL